MGRSMNKQSDRARAKHQVLVADHMKLMTRRDKLLETLVRIELRAAKSKRAIARSQKRLNKLVIALHNCGPTASPVPDLIRAVANKPASTDSFNDELPAFA
jgi:hypothetical protein